jgi:hypothetical protein
MRPINIVVLLLAGALSGALIMKVAHPGKPALRTALVTRVQAAEPPSTVNAPPVELQPAPIVVPEAAKLSPMPLVASPIRREAPKPPRIRTVETLVVEPEPAAPQALALAPAPAKYAVPVQDSVPVQEPAPVPAPAPAPPPVSPPMSAVPVPPPHQVTLNAGLLLPVRLVDGLSSERNVPGDAFVATLNKELVAEGFVIAERGARVEGRVVAVDRAKVKTTAALAVELTLLHTSDDQSVPIQTDSFFKHADAQVDNATKIAGGAIIGAAIGAVAAGGKGAAIGAGIGGGAGAGDVLLTRKPAELPSETLVTFKLKSDVPLTEKLRE